MKALFDILYSIYVLIIQFPALLALILILLIQYLAISVRFVSYIVQFLPTPFAVAGVVLVFVNIVLKVIKR